jgi:hypothetical protein
MSRSPSVAKKSASKQIDKLIANLGDWRGARLAEIRKLIHAADPDVLEEWKWMGSPTWSHAGIYAVGNAHKDKVKLTFAHGAALPDPKKLFNAALGGGTWRAIDFREGDKTNKAALKTLVRAAVAYNTTVPKSKGSTAKRGKKSAKTAMTSRRQVLLSGGNPQIDKADGDAPVQAYIAAMPAWKKDVGRRLDALIVRTVPGVRKAVKWNSPFYGVEGQGWFLAFRCITKYVKVAFFRGGSLSPMPPVESKDRNTRYLHIHEHDELDEALVMRWIQQASVIPGWVP